MIIKIDENLKTMNEKMVTKFMANVEKMNLWNNIEKIFIQAPQ